MTNLLGSDLVALLADAAGLEALEEIVVLATAAAGVHDAHRVRRQGHRRPRAGGRATQERRDRG